MRVASLTVLDRLVVCLARAGVGRIIVVGDSPAPLERAAALGLAVEHTEKLPAVPGALLVASGNVLATPADLRRLIGSRARLATAEGEPLPLGVLDEAGEDWQACLDRLPVIAAIDLAAQVDTTSVRRVDRAYWASLTSSSDGWVDRHFNRPVGRLLSKRLAGTSVTPNQVSIVSTLVGLVAGGLFAVGTPVAAVAGAVILQVSAILDCVDGDLARALFKQSPLGKWLDIVGDQVVHVAVFLGLGVGLWRSGSTAPVIALGMVAAVGVVLSFLVVMRALLKPSLRGHNRLQKLIDATTNRDFSVLLILFAIFDVLDWFLWLAAVGSHLFWLVAVGLQIQESRSGRRHAEST